MDSVSENRPFKTIPASVSQEDGLFATLLELENNPHFVVKEIPPDKEGSLEIERTRKQSRKIAEGFEWAKDVKDHLEIFNSDPELRRFIPENFLVYGSNDKGGKRVFIVMEKVRGLKLEEASPTADEFIQLGNLIDVSLDFYYKGRVTLSSGKERSYFPDIVQRPPSGDGFLTNIMIGKTRRDKTDRVYLIDNYPLLIFDGVDGELKMLRGLKQALYWYDYNVFKKWWGDNKTSLPEIDTYSFENWFKTKAVPVGLTREYPLLTKFYFEDQWLTANNHPWVKVYVRILPRIDKLIASAEERFSADET